MRSARWCSPGLLTGLVNAVITAPFNSISWLVQAIAAALATVVTLPYGVLVGVLLYLDLSARKERLSLETSGRTCKVRPSEQHLGKRQQAAASRTPRRRSQPQGHRGRLDGLVDHRQQLGGQRLQVQLLARAGAERCDGGGGVIAPAVEAPVHRVLDAAAGGLERRGDRQRGDRHRQARGAAEHQHQAARAYGAGTIRDLTRCFA
jgi:hypothetical protein